MTAASDSGEGIATALAPPGGAAMRIGELAERVGLSTHVLRAWELRYGVFRPVRSTGGYRLYGARDEQRLRAILAARARGVSTSEAARQVLLADPELAASAALEGGVAGVLPRVGQASAAVERLLEFSANYDATGMDSELERWIDGAGIEVTLELLVVPFLVELGRAWEHGRLGIAHEHFASHVVRSRLSQHVPTRAGAAGPVAVLAAPASEQHDILLLGLAALLVRRGWTVRFLGANTPASALVSVVIGVHPDLVVLASRSTSLVREAFDCLGASLEVDGQAPLLAAAGPAAAGFATAEPVVACTGGPVASADLLTSLVATSASRLAKASRGE